MDLESVALTDFNVDAPVDQPASAVEAKPIKTYANKTFCWKKLYPEATETWAEVCNNKDDERVKKCEEAFSQSDKVYRQLKKAWDEAHPSEKTDAANASTKAKKGGGAGKKSKKRARKVDDDEDDTGLAMDLSEYIRATVYKLFQSDKKAYVERKQIYRELITVLESGEVPATEHKDEMLDVDAIIDSVPVE